MSILERATNAAIKFGLIFIMMISILIVQERKVENEEGDESCCPAQETRGEESQDSISSSTPEAAAYQLFHLI
jgi:hypothetical protein